MSDETLANLSHEERRFAPPAELAKDANVTAEAYDEAEADRLAFWDKQADRLEWGQKWERTLEVLRTQGPAVAEERQAA